MLDSACLAGLHCDAGSSRMTLSLTTTFVGPARRVLRATARCVAAANPHDQREIVDEQAIWSLGGGFVAVAAANPHKALTRS